MNTLNSNENTENIVVDVKSVVGQSSDSPVDYSNNQFSELFSNDKKNKKEEDHGTFIQQAD